MSCVTFRVPESIRAPEIVEAGSGGDVAAVEIDRAVFPGHHTSDYMPVTYLEKSHTRIYDSAALEGEFYEEGRPGPVNCEVHIPSQCAVLMPGARPISGSVLSGAQART